MHVTILSTPITGTVHGRFHQLLPSKATSQLSFKFSDSLQICFIVVELLLPYSNMPILKAWGSTSRAQRPLTTGIVGRQFPSRGNTWRNNGRSALASSTYAPFTCRLLTFMGWNWKLSVLIVIKTDLSGFVVTMHSGLCRPLQNWS